MMPFPAPVLWMALVAVARDRVSLAIKTNCWGRHLLPILPLRGLWGGKDYNKMDSQSWLNVEQGIRSKVSGLISILTKLCGLAN